MRPEESGATLMGPLLIREQTRRGEREIHCQEDVGTGGYQIPNNPDMIEFLDDDIDFALAVETGGMRDRLVENGFDEAYNCLVIHLKGQPARATRRITKRVHDELDVPVAVFADGDPWSYRIYGSVAYGSIKSAHLSKYLATPEAQFVGIQPEDIVEYDLPADPLADSDINALESELEDPRFQTDYWEEQIELQLDIGKKSEQQSLASRGLDFVTDTYLPERLDAMGRDLSPPGDTSLLVRFVEFADLAALTVRVVVHVLINDPVLLVGGRVVRAVTERLRVREATLTDVDHAVVTHVGLVEFGRSVLLVCDFACHGRQSTPTRIRFVAADRERPVRA